MLQILLLCMLVGSLEATLYNCYTSKPATYNEIMLFRQRNNVRYCLIDVKPCDPYDWRRVDGSCTNPRYPSRGMSRTPLVRVLPSSFSKVYEPRNAKDGSRLPPTRVIRTNILKEGKASDMSITQLVSFYFYFAQNDIMSLHDTFYYIYNLTTCCQPQGKSNYECTPVNIQNDDPVLRFSNVRCQNLTRPLSFQYLGCAPFGTTEFSRISFSTPMLDLSIIYGNDIQIGSINQLRTFSNGQLKIEIQDGKIFPPSKSNLDPRTNGCPGNVLPRETRCNLYQQNGMPGPTFLTMLYYRQHNYIAKNLASLNPCWSDDRLFYTARDMNIAMFTQILFYELLPEILGRKNLVKDGIITSDGGYRDFFNENVFPQLTEEFAYVNRWFHTIQEPEFKFYDTNYNFLRTYPLPNITARTGFFSIDDNMGKISRGSFLQPGAAFDHTIAYDLAQRSFGKLQFASDVAAKDLKRGRYFGFQPYIKYRTYCTGRTYKTFDCLEDSIEKARIYRLRQVYKNVEDIDLMAGIYSERRVAGGKIPVTMYCLFVDQVKRLLQSDMHWYERPNRPHAFTPIQLKSIRKASIAALICRHGDGVTRIQPRAFYSISPSNPLTPCSSSKISKVIFSAWKDPQCVIL